MADVGATIDTVGVEDVEQVIDIGVESGVAAKIEEVRVDTAGTDEVIENDSVVGCEVRENSLPHGLVCAEAMSQNQGSLTGPFYTDIEIF